MKLGAGTAVPCPYNDKNALDNVGTHKAAGCGRRLHTQECLCHLQRRAHTQGRRVGHPAGGSVSRIKSNLRRYSTARLPQLSAVRELSGVACF